MTPALREKLQRTPTRTLLGWRIGCYACGGQYDPFHDGYQEGYTLEEIKEELAKRPHIPNKKEGRILRRELAKKKQ